MACPNAQNDAVLSTQPKTIADFDPPKKPKLNKYALACTILDSMTSVLLGYDIGVMSGAATYIREDLNLNDTQIEILGGVIGVSCLIGSGIAGRTSDWIGRRYTIAVAGVIFFVGALLMGLATNYASLMLGRIVAGIAVGHTLMIAPVYTAEFSPSSIRGFLTSFHEVFLNSGVLLGYISNYGFSKLPTFLGWRLMLGVSAIPSVEIAIGVLAMPKSPRWLVMQGRLGEARRVLEKISDTPEDAQLTLADIKKAAGIPEEQSDEIVQVHKKSHGEGVWRELLIRPTPVVRHILIAGVGIHFFQQASGVHTVVLYSSLIFEKAGITSHNEKLLATIVLGFSKTIFIFISTFLLDKVGRRPLLLSSVGCMTFSLAMLAMSLTVIDNNQEKVSWARALAIAMTLAVVVSFSMGLGPIAWVYSSEIFPLRLRAQGASMVVAANRLTSGTISMTILSLYKAITIGGAFFLFSGVALTSWFFFFFCLPETQGRTLEDMEILFGKLFKRRPIFMDKKKKEMEMAKSVSDVKESVTSRFLLKMLDEKDIEVVDDEDDDFTSYEKNK